jgi:uncharacterized protein (DUF488 family)
MAITKAYSIGFTRKSAAEFFEILRDHDIHRLVDIRLNNQSQLAGFTKSKDLAFFLRQILGAEYEHLPMLAPTQELLTSYRKGRIAWAEYERRFLALMKERNIERNLDRSMFETPTVLLCTEPSAERCHRRLVLEYLRDKWGHFEIVHL